jgi:hypothetical protein
MLTIWALSTSTVNATRIALLTTQALSSASMSYSKRTALKTRRINLPQKEQLC